MLHLPAALLSEVHAHGAASYPLEGCGLLLGRQEGEANVVEAILPVPNSWPHEAEKPERFAIAPADMLRAELTAAERGLDVIGVFHSHPDHPPVASPRDLAWAAWSGYSYLITRVAGGLPAESRSWQLLPDRSGFVEEEMIG